MLAFALATAVLAYVVVVRREEVVVPSRPAAPAPRSVSGAGSSAAALPSRRIESSLPKQIAKADDEVRVEIATVSALHRMDADLGEPIDLSRAPGGGVVVTGRGLPHEREQHLAEGLAAIPGVAVRFEQVGGVGPDTAQPQLSVRASYTVLEVQLEASLGGHGGVEEFANALLSASDEAMTRVHALHNLEERFPGERLAGLTGEQRAELARIAEDHRTALRTHVARIRSSLDRVYHALGRGDGSAAPVAGASLLDSALRLDRALNVAFAGAEGTFTVPQLLAEFDTSLRQVEAAMERSR